MIALIEDESEVKKKSRLRWDGHVIWRNEDCVGKRAMNMELPGKKKRGRPCEGRNGSFGTNCRRCE